MNAPAKIAALLAVLLAMSFPLAGHRDWGSGPSIILGTALLAMLSLVGWRRWRHE